MRPSGVANQRAIGRTGVGAQLRAADPMRVHGEHIDPRTLQVIPQRLAEAFQRVFTRHIPCVARHTHAALNAGDGSELAATLLEIRQGMMHAMHGSEIIDLHQLAENIQVFHLFKRRPHAEASVREINVHPAKLVNRGLHQSTTILGLCNITDYRECFATDLLADRGGFIQLRFLTAVQHTTCTTGGEIARQLAAEAR